MVDPNYHQTKPPHLYSLQVYLIHRIRALSRGIG